jgi:hypothetical protein
VPYPDLTRKSIEPGMSEPTPRVATDRDRIVRELHELIAALDRRVPHVHRMGELAIARAAAALRGEALKRIEELEGDAALDVSSVETG